MVITGAPNLSNEAGVRGEVRSVSKEEGEQRVENEDRESRVNYVRTKCWSCRQRMGCMFILECGC